MQKIPKKYILEMPPLKFLEAVSSGAGWRHEAMARSRVFEDTVGLVCSGSYTSECGKEIEFSSLDQMCSGTRMCSNKMDVQEAKQRFDTVFEVVNGDCLEEAQRLVHQGLSPALLNLANGEVPCAGTVAFQTQEESIFRRTTLFLSLYQYWKGYRNLSDVLQAVDYCIPQRDNQYPLSMYGAIYSPDVTVFRSTEREGYALMNSPFDIAVITSAALQDPDIEGRRLCREDRDITKEKIRTILRMGMHFGHDSLVLGAYGCGAFHNPPGDMARIFHEVFEEPEFKGAFRHVSFAIFDDSFCGRAWNPEGNFLPFKKEFSKR